MSHSRELPLQRLGDLIDCYSSYMKPISISALDDAKRSCSHCNRPMCDFYTFNTSHRCHNELRCEAAFRLIECGHVMGQECLLRQLEKFGKCPVCRDERRVKFDLDSGTFYRVDEEGNRLVRTDSEEELLRRLREAEERARLAELNLGVGQAS